MLEGYLPLPHKKMTEDIEHLAKRARAASFVMQSLSEEARNGALMHMKQSLLDSKAQIFEANTLDKSLALETNVDSTLQARLNVMGDKFDTLIEGLDILYKMEDLVGKTQLAREITPGLNLYRISNPIGVICVIFESRPEAVIQIASLVIKSGNCVILKGGKEAAKSNQALVDALRLGLDRAGLPQDAIQLVASRGEVEHLLKLNQYVDLIIPRGGNALVRHVMDHTSIAVLGHADGICHTYLDSDCSELVDMACSVVVDAKTNYPAACNSLETLLVHRSVLHSVLPRVGAALHKAGVVMIADRDCLDVLPPGSAELAPSGFQFNVEHLALKLSVKVVDSLQQAVDHINEFGSHHTDVIVTSNVATAEEFCRKVDSAGTFVNCSSRFADGFRFGFGFEVGVSTNRLHARGPVGIEGLLTYKYVMRGNGQVVTGMKVSDYTHVDLTPKNEEHSVKRLKPF